MWHISDDLKPGNVPGTVWRDEAPNAPFMVQFASCGTTVGPFATFDDAKAWASIEGVDINGDTVEYDICPMVAPADWVYPPA